MIKFLLAKGADVNLHFRVVEGTPLNHAVEAPRALPFYPLFQVCQLLLDHGADIKFRCDATDRTLPHTALYSKAEIDTIRLLIDHGADVNAAHFNGDMPLQIAEWQGNQDIVRLLLENGAGKVLEVGKASITLKQAVQWDKREMVISLLSGGAKATDHDSIGRPAPCYAIQCGAVELVELLLKKGVDPSAPALDERGGISCPPIVTAVRASEELLPKSDAIVIMQLLLNYGASVNEEDSRGHTALHWATLSCRFEEVQFLRRNGADAEDRDD